MQVLRETRQQLVPSSALASIAELSAGISHKVNNLLTVISGYAPLRALLPESVSLVIDPVDPGLVVRFDPAHLDQMVPSLAVNARDSMLRG